MRPAERISKRGFYLLGGFMNSRLFRSNKGQRWTHWRIP